MSIILLFLKKHRFFLMFIALELISIVLIINKNSFHRLVFNQNIIAFNGWYGNTINSITSYFNLKEDNKILQEENNRLKSLLYGTRKIDSMKIRSVEDSLRPMQVYEYISATTSGNKIIYQDNYYYVNRGSSSGIKPDLGVITPEGIAGQIIEVSTNHSKVMSVLNSKIKVNGRIKSKDYFGTLIWKGHDPRIMNMEEIPKYAEVEIGDTIETANSSIFPEGIPIGRIAGLDVEQKTGNWDVSVELFQEMARLNKVNIVRKIRIRKPINIDSINRVYAIKDSLKKIAAYAKKDSLKKIEILKQKKDTLKKNGK